MKLDLKSISNRRERGPVTRATAVTHSEETELIRRATALDEIREHTEMQRDLCAPKDCANCSAADTDCMMPEIFSVLERIDK